MLEESCTLQDLLLGICKDYQSYSEKCHDYWLMNFSPEVFQPKFFDAINETNYTFFDLIKSKMHKADLFTKVLPPDTHVRLTAALLDLKVVSTRGE